MKAVIDYAGEPDDLDIGITNTRVGMVRIDLGPDLVFHLKNEHFDLLMKKIEAYLS